MKVVSVALAASYSSVLSLQGLDTNGPIGLGLSVAETTTDTFVLYGTLDAAAVDNTNAQALGQFGGGSSNLPKGIADQAKTWPFLLVQRTGGATAGSFFAAGNPAASPSVVTTAAPVVAGNYSALMTLTTLGAQWIRIGGARAMTASDVFDLFLSNDATLASSTGAYYAGRFTGGGGTALISVLESGFNYAIIQRVSGSTAGNIIAAGVAPSGGGGVLNLTTLSVGDTAANGNIGTPPLTAAQSVDIYSSFLLTQTTAGVTATLPNPTITTAGKVALVMNNDTSTQVIVMYGMVLSPGTAQWLVWDGTAWIGGGNITQNGNAFGTALRIGTVDNQNVVISRNLISVLSAVAASLTLGDTTGAYQSILQAGTGGIALNSGGDVSANVAAGSTGNISSNATDHTTIVGGNSGVSATSVRGGTAGIVVSTGGGPVRNTASQVDTPPAAIADGTGSLGAAAATVDVASVLEVNQTTPVITYADMRTIPAPTDATLHGRRVKVINVGTAAFTVGDATQLQGVNLSPGNTPGGAASSNKGNACEFMWSGTAWCIVNEPLQDPVQAGTANATGNTPRAGRVTEYQITNIAGGDVVLTCTLTGAIIGDVILFTRPDANAHTATINNSAAAAQFVMPNSKKNFCKVRYNGSDWEFMEGGTQ